jgi:predicted metal-dependent phosphoesterase TrpH
MHFDIHVHTRRYSPCSSIEPEQVLRRANRLGLDGIAFTEHHIRWPDDKLEALLLKTRNDGLVVVIGEEVACFEKGGRMQGHFLVFGVGQSLGANLPVDEMIRIVHGEGGVVIPAHPYKKSRVGDGHYGAADSIRCLDVDAIETYHPEHDEEAILKIREISKQTGIPLTGGSDAHELSSVGSYVTVFEEEIKGEAQFLEAIRKGKISPGKGWGRS